MNQIIGQTMRMRTNDIILNIFHWIRVSKDTMFGNKISNNSAIGKLCSQMTNRNEMLICHWNLMPHEITICFFGKLHIWRYNYEQTLWILRLISIWKNNWEILYFLEKKLFIFFFQILFRLGFIFILRIFSHSRCTTRKWTQAN